LYIHIFITPSIVLVPEENQMKLISLRLFIIALVTLLFAGCLTVDKKEYHYKVNNDGSGEGWIKFYNIKSAKDGEEDVSLKDFAELIDDYVKGTRFEDDNPSLQVTSKDLMEEDGKLNGLVKFKFNSLSEISFLYEEGCGCAPVYYSMGGFLSETFASSNGTYLGEGGGPQIIKWPAGTKDFSFTTTVSSDTTTVDLLNQYKAWKAGQK